jgi:hypothetical protein
MPPKQMPPKQMPSKQIPSKKMPSKQLPPKKMPPKQNNQQEKHNYGMLSVMINNKIKTGNTPQLNNNNAVRNFAYNEYKGAGLKKKEIQQRMDHKDAGHIKAKNNGGKNTNSNYMWEDRHANRAHGDETVHASVMQRAGRK